jgi:hypothetical protein
MTPPAILVGLPNALVIGPALSRVGNGFEGLYDFPEPGSLHAGSRVRVVFLNESSKGTLDFGLGGTAAHAQNFVVGVVRGHRPKPSP